MATKAVSPPKDNMALGLALVGGGAVILLLSKAKSSSSPTLKVTPATISPGGTLNFTFDHFPVGVSIGVASPACSQAVIVISNSGGSGSGVIVVDTSEAGEFVLNASVIVGTKTYTASANFSVIVGGWMPALKAIPSATATSGPPQVGGWIPALTTVYSAIATYTPAQTGGWIPTLTAIVSGNATYSPAQVGGWAPTLTAVVYASASLKTLTPTLTCTSSLKTGGTLSFNFTGFAPNASIWVGVVGGGGAYITADSTGAGSSGFQVGESAGSYTLEASDNSSHIAYAYFTVTSSTLVPQMVVSPTTIASGQSITWTFYNFTPGQSVGVSLIGGGGLNITANALGSGTGSFIINETVAGQYGIQATDNLGEYAMALFTVTVPNPPPSGGPTFPAPGRVGDGNFWYWIEWMDGTYGWDDYYDVVIAHNPLIKLTIAGPYASGATG